MTEISIPGDPRGLQALAGQLRTAASDVGSVQSRVTSNGLNGSWSGRASSAFHSTLHELPGELSPIVAAFDDAAQALATFAARLAELQGQARWCEGQIGNAQQELRAANTRHAAAQAKLSAARLAHSAATDPVSLHTAQSAMKLGESLMRQAGADIEDIGGGIAQLRSRAQGILNSYDDAVRACCSSLDAARHAGGRSLTGWMRTHVGGLLGHARHDLVAWWRDGTGLARDVEDGVERFGNDALEAFDREWADARQILVDTSSALGDATLLVCGGVLVFVGALAATGFGAPAAAVIAGADLAVIEAADDVIEAESIAILAGDSLEIKRGHREYLNELPSDGLGVVPGSKVFAPLERRAGRAIRSSPGLRKATQSLVRTAKRVLSPTVAKREGKGILKLGEDAAKDQVDNGMEFVEHNFKPLISAPLERPLTFKLVLPLLSPAAR